MLLCDVVKIGHNMKTPPKKSTLFSILSSVFDSCFPPPGYHDQSHKTEPGPTPVIAVIMYRRPSDYISQLYSDYIQTILDYIRLYQTILVNCQKLLDLA